MTIEFLLLIIAAYLLGSVPAAYLIAKWSRGIDLRKYGSGNVGGSNLIKATSVKLAVPAIVYDLIKGALPVWVAQLLGMGPAEQMAAGIFAVIGHNWPVFLSFQGGRGMLTSLAVVFMMSPILGLILLVMAYSLAPFKQMALSVLIALASMPLFSWFLNQPLNIEERLPVTVGFAVLLLIAVVRRLAVPRSALSESVPLMRLSINRLLFDRDIADRKAWINRRPLEDKGSGKTGGTR